MKRAEKLKQSKRESRLRALLLPHVRENSLMSLGITVSEPPAYRVNFIFLFISNKGNQPNLYFQI